MRPTGREFGRTLQWRYVTVEVSARFLRPANICVIFAIDFDIISRGKILLQYGCVLCKQNLIDRIHAVSKVAQKLDFYGEELFYSDGITWCWISI